MANPIAVAYPDESPAREVLATLTALQSALRDSRTDGGLT
jgi:hypothetical protein